MGRIHVLLLAGLLSAVCADAQTSREQAPREQAPREIEVVREDVPKLVIPKRVVASETPSGLAVPRWVSLKSSMRCRQGPSRAHRELWRYGQAGLPLVVVAEAEGWRRVRDVNGDQCWIFAQGLSGVRGALVTKDVVVVRAWPEVGARARARVGRGSVVRLEACRDGWCEVATRGETSYRGWVLQAGLWGTQRL